MSHFYGKVKGNRGEATRGGSKASGYTAIAASWNGSVITELFVNSDGVDSARVYLDRWQGAGSHHMLYEGPIDPQHVMPNQDDILVGA